MNKYLKKGLLLFGAAILGFTLGIIKNNNKPQLLEEKEIIILYNELDSTKNEIDTIYVEINKVNDNYKKVINTIINNDSNDDFRFFIEYIGSQKQRLDSICENL